MGGKSSPPPAPDYTAAANATAAGNLDAARYATYANRATQVTPYGTSSWSVSSNPYGYTPSSSAAAQAPAAASSPAQPVSGWNPALSTIDPSYPQTQAAYDRLMGTYGGGSYESSPGQYGGGGTTSGGFSPEYWTNTITLSPQVQSLVDQQLRLSNAYGNIGEGMLGQVQNSYQQPFDTSGLQQVNLPSASNFQTYDPGTLDQNYINQMRQLMVQQAQPYLDTQRTGLETQLRNQGVQPGSEAWNNAMMSVNQTQSDLWTNAALNAAQMGEGVYTTNLAGVNSKAAQNQALAQYLINLANQQQGLRGQQFQESAYARELPLTELNALRTGSQPTMPQFGSYPQQQATTGPDLLGATNAQYQNQLAGYNAQQAASGNFLSGLLGLGGTLGSAYMLM